MPLMIWVCIIIELGIQNWLDAGILLIIQFVNATLGWYETVKAADAVAALKASLKPVGKRVVFFSLHPSSSSSCR